MDMFLSSSSRSNISNFCWKHRGKIAVATLGIGAVLGAAYYYYDEENKDGLCSDEDSDDDEDEATGPDPAAIQRRTNEIIAVNDLFDFSLIYFLPTIRQKVKEVVDVTDTVKKLKELRKSGNVPDQYVSKSALWREMQLSAFNSLLTIVYAISGASLLLMVQMHLLVRSSNPAPPHPSSSLPRNTQQDHSGIFRELMEETFGVFFSSGIHNLSHINKSAIEVVFEEVKWTVEQTLSVRYEDLQEVLQMMKLKVEGGKDGQKQVKELLSLLFMGGARDDDGKKEHTSSSKASRRSVSFLPSVDHPDERSSLIRVPSILEETWQILESPLFERAFLDTTDAVFASISQQLWEEVFRPLEQTAFGYPQEHLQLHKQEEERDDGERKGVLHPGSPNSPVELGSPDASPGNTSPTSTSDTDDTQSVKCHGDKDNNIKKKDKQNRMASEHKFRDASIPLAKLLPKIKAVAFKLVPDDQPKQSSPMPSTSSSTSEYDDMFSRLAPPPSNSVGGQRSPSLQRIRSLCGADDSCSNSFNLCAMLLEKKLGVFP